MTTSEALLSVLAIRLAAILFVGVVAHALAAHAPATVQTNASAPCSRIVRLPSGPGDIDDASAPEILLHD
jgi:hypothetical protein